MASSSTTTFSFAFKVSSPIARSSTTSLRTTPTIIRLSQFTKKSSLNLSSSHTISGFSPILPRLTFPTQTPQSLTLVSAKGYKMKTHKASAKRFRVTGSGKIMRRRAGKQQSDSNWFLDPGATSHMTNDLSGLSFYQPYQGHDQGQAPGRIHKPITVSQEKFRPSLSEVCMEQLRF